MESRRAHPPRLLFHLPEEVQAPEISSRLERDYGVKVSEEPRTSLPNEGAECTRGYRLPSDDLYPHRGSLSDGYHPVAHPIGQIVALNFFWLYPFYLAGGTPPVSGSALSGPYLKTPSIPVQSSLPAVSDEYIRSIYTAPYPLSAPF